MHFITTVPPRLRWQKAGAVNPIINALCGNLSVPGARRELGEATRPGKGNIQVNISETAEAVHVDVALPGVAKEDITLEVDGKKLTITARRNTPDEKEGNYIRQERATADFGRIFQLPFAIEDNRISAVYKDGILQLTIPKPQNRTATKITVH